MRFWKKKSGVVDGRSWEHIREHFEVERELAQRLHNASKEERKALYTKLYDELLVRLPHHPLHTRQEDPGRERAIETQFRLLRERLARDTTYLEIGPGDCRMAFKVSNHAKRVIAIDVSNEALRNPDRPDNFELIISDGSSIDVPSNTVDVAFSNHLMEHLHPDDALEQLENVFAVLASGGCYVCVTPNRLFGPSDISKYFTRVATGFHLKEYTNRELCALFRSVGFRKIKVYVGLKGRYVKVPVHPVILAEHMVRLIPHRLRRKTLTKRLVGVLLGVRIVGVKG